MDRRDFMKLAGACGLVLASPLTTREAEAQEAAPYTGPLYIFVGASGGWDPTSFADPKGFLSETEENPMNRLYAAADIANAGNIPYAPFTGAGSSYGRFVEKHYQQMLVLNGLDTQTNGHDSGRRNAASGKLAEGFPAFGALVAAQYGGGMPMGFITNGFYDDTAGTTARTRVGNLNAFQRIARPNAINPNDPTRGYHTDDTFKRIMEAQQSRVLAMKEQLKLPKSQRSLGTLHLARGADNVLGQLLEALPEQRGNGLALQAQLAIAAYKVGATVSATLSTGGFDTHGNHDNGQLPSLDRLWDGVDAIWTEAERQGVADRVVVVVGSDFGRTPGYNMNNGKDHWSVTSMVCMGQGIQGNRVVGASTQRHGLMTIDPTTLQPSESGVRLKPGHVHWALRKLSGLDKTRFHQEFQLDVDEFLPLFGG
jgi:uncharacterized protein (DUF1501 family)